MKSQEQFLRELIGLLGECAIPFMLTGSLASSFHGRPRATNDVDIIIDPSSEALDRLIESLPTEWYVSVSAARDALMRRSMFNIIDGAAGWKADLMIRKDRPYSIVEFARQALGEIMGTRVPVVTPEDSILSKLEWSRESASGHQYADALAVAVLNRSTLDRIYLEQWAKELSLESPLRRLLDESQHQPSTTPRETK